MRLSEHNILVILFCGLTGLHTQKAHTLSGISCLNAYATLLLKPPHTYMHFNCFLGYAFISGLVTSMRTPENIDVCIQVDRPKCVYKKTIKMHISVVPTLCNRRLCGHRQAATHLSPRHRHMFKNGGILKWLYLWNRLTDFDALTFS